ncbi:MAG: adenylyltransferase/cytidyltransferase family protein [Candidatus Parcubacteria bacterium]|nr:adenylyltransferase/cytidyltransferase family protein [Candidatus Parcubacteria bacterium]
MKPIYVYPGSFDPPTFGHLHLVMKAAELFPEVIVVCSVNGNKRKQWFTPDEAKIMWQTYDLRANVKVKTLEEIGKEVKDFSEVVMIRGIRNQSDLEENIGVVMLNYEQFGITNFVYLFAAKEYQDISSTKARKAMLCWDYDKLKQLVNPKVLKCLEFRLSEKAEAIRLVRSQNG